MKFTCLSVCGIIASNLLGATARSLENCKDEFQSWNKLMGDGAVNHTAARTLAENCQSCRAIPEQRTDCDDLRDASDWEGLCECVAMVQQRPVYAIANRVLEAKHIQTALDHGANAIEIDVMAWSAGWWADHLGTLGSYGDTMEQMFESIAKHKDRISFVWLELKNPDYYDAGHKSKWYHCSVRKLRDLVQEHLEPANVAVLYSFPSSDGDAYNYISKNLGKQGAIALTGRADVLREKFASDPAPKLGKRVMSYGYFDWATGFHGWQAELENGVRSQAFGKVFGWTYAGGREQNLDSALDSGIDGLVYGFKDTAYYDHDNVRLAMSDIRNWVQRHSDRAYLATKEHKPW